MSKTVKVLLVATVSFAVLLAIAYAVAPQITLDSPPDGSYTFDRSVDLVATVTDGDNDPMTVWFYGGTSDPPTDLLYVKEDVPSGTQLTHTWAGPVLEVGIHTAALWHFDEDAGDSVYDETGNHNDGELVGDPEWTPDGRFGYAVDFDGSGDYVTISDDPSLDIDSATGALTMEAWIYPHAVGTAVYQGIIAKRGIGQSQQNYSMWINPTDSNLVFCGGTYPSGWRISTVSVASNEWSYIAITLDAQEGKLRFYRNGVIGDSIADSWFGEANDDELTIGVAGNVSQIFNGLIDDVRITKRVLTAEEIAANYRLALDTHYWEVMASDGVDTTTSETRSFVVTDVNLPPVLDSIGPKTVDEGVNLTFEVTATDPVGVIESLTTSELPPGATFIDHGGGLGTFDWTPDFTQSGGYYVNFYATDDSSAVDSEVVLITVNNVNRPPVLDPIGPKLVDEGANLTFDVTANDPDGTIPELTTSPLPPGAEFTDHGNGTGTFDWTPDFTQSGQHYVTFYATDDLAAVDSERVQIIVYNVNRPPVLDSIGPKTVDEGDALTFGVAASDPDGTIPELTALTLPPGAEFTDHGNGTGTFDWTPDFTQSGEYDVTFYATDDLTAVDSEVVQIVVIPDTALPEVTLNYPSNDSLTTNNYMQLSATVWDKSPMTVWIYGDTTGNASDLLYVEEDVIGTDIIYDWTAPVLQPDPLNTMGLWRFDENDGDVVYDESDNDNDGELVGAPAWTPDGRFGYAIDFDGLQDYVTIPDDSSLDVDSATGAITMEAWVYPHAVGGGHWRGIVAKRGFGKAVSNYAMLLDASFGKLTFVSGSASVIYISSVNVPPNEWSCVAITLDAAEERARFYLNGVPADSVDDVPFGPAHDDPLHIGAAGSTAECFYGLIDEVRITNRALDSDEIAANYALGNANYYWKVRAGDASANDSTSETRYFVVANEEPYPPEIILNSPPNDSTALGPSMELSVTVLDESPMTVWIYGGATADASDLLHVKERVNSTDTIVHDWIARVLGTEPPNTMGLWHFDENAGDSVYDETGNHNDGELVGDPEWTPDGRFGYAVDFDGSGDYVTISDDPSLDIDSATGALTMEAWIYPHAVGTAVYQGIIAKRGIGQSQQNYSMWINPTDSNLVFCGGTYPSGWRISTVSVASNEWSYIAITLDAQEGKLRFYRNGVIGDSIADSWFGETNDDELTIGVAGNVSQIFDGLVDEVRITNRVLSPAEIAGNYGLSSGTYYWRVRAKDASANESSSETRHFNIYSEECDCIPGDADSGLGINVADLTYMVDYLFFGGPAPVPYQICSGDLDASCAVNVADLTYLVDYLFFGGPPPCSCEDWLYDCSPPLREE